VIATTAPIDLGATLRALRRRADLSQRQLAERAGVPASTVARIESGAARDPRFRTVERLVAAAGGVVTAGDHPQAALDVHRGLVDSAGRRYPAHLDVRQVVEAKDWWGAWWANWYDLPRPRWPREAPDHTFDLDRARRDGRRRREAGRAAVVKLQIERLAAGPGVPPDVWRWVARDRTGAVVGWVGCYLRMRRADGQRELVIGDIEVAPAWRRFGLGRRLLGMVRAGLPAAGARRARVLIDEPELPHEFFRACGFHLLPPQPGWLTMLDRG